MILHERVRFLQGFGSAIALIPAAQILQIPQIEKSDQEAIAEDWNATGNDLQEAIVFYANSIPRSPRHEIAKDDQLKLW